MVTFTHRKPLQVLFLIGTLAAATMQTTNHRQAAETHSPAVVNALIVVDVQNCFISGNLSLVNSPAGQDGAEVVPVINHLLRTVAFDIVVYTHDWHPSDHISFFENLNKRRHYLKGDQNKTYNPSDTVMYTGPKAEMEQMLWPAHCVQGTDDAKLHRDLIVDSSSNSVFHVRKGNDSDVDSYSAFWDNYRFQKTELEHILERWNVTHVYVTGLATDYCVAATALDAVSLNYTTYLIEDACRGVDTETIRNKTQEMRQRGVTVIHSSQVQRLVNRARGQEIGFLIVTILTLLSFVCK